LVKLKVHIVKYWYPYKYNYLFYQENAAPTLALNGMVVKPYTS
jgi:hypothetical protein